MFARLTATFTQVLAAVVLVAILLLFGLPLSGASWAEVRAAALNLVGTLLGVLAAFGLQRITVRHRARDVWAEQVAACIYSLANAHTITRKLRASVKPGSRFIMPIAAPALQTALNNPLLHEHTSPGVVHVLTATDTLLRSLSRAVDVTGMVLTDEAASDLRSRADILVRVIECAQGVLEQELGRLGRSLFQTDEDRVMIARLERAVKRDGA